jgi:LmbE family N-acetylglucosaminyl deacetylase
MFVFAHPDDEAFGTGGTMSKYADMGYDVYLVTATRGESGQIAEPELATPANLPDVRERELRCACEIYGIHPPRFMGYVDGQLTTVHQGQAVGKLVRLIRELQPQVLVTFGPDGVYGHYDHIAVHRWTTIAAKLAADPDCFPDPDLCEPYEVAKVYYRSLTEEQVESMAEEGLPASVMMDGVPFVFVPTPQDQLTTRIDVGDYVDQKLEGIRCHATQIGRQSPFNETPDEVLRDDWFRQETYTLAHSTVGWPEEMEHDLFAGLN